MAEEKHNKIRAIKITLPSKKSGKLGIACALIIIILTGCASGFPETNFCLIYKPVYHSRNDTELTKSQIDKNNAVWLELCQD